MRYPEKRLVLTGVVLAVTFGLWLVMVWVQALTARGEASVAAKPGKEQDEGGFGALVEQTSRPVPIEPKVEVAASPIKVELPGAVWVPQTYNNCGPAATAMLLQYFGYYVSQVETKAKLRSGDSDTNVFTYEIAEYISEDFGLESKLLFGGDIERLKSLLANGVYIVVEDWLHPFEDIGHVLVIRGYDDQKGVLIADDSFVGVGVEYEYETFLAGQWKPFNFEYLPVYRADKEEVVKAIVGEDWDEGKMYEGAVAKNRALVEINSEDMYAWFNLGTSYYGLGEYKQAGEAFLRARSLGWPGRMLWYQIQPVQTFNELGQYELALELANEGLRGNNSFAELHVEAARAYLGLGERERARSHVEAALGVSPTLDGARGLMEVLGE